ncbi:caspase family protein [Streptomyces sp. NBC_00047]|uniref:caspase, EACC1-associated type n=1 Tax=Streptomyces sp. NBC_00047 TaxID=2975627 RepID=UPI0022510277|nr:caspase family protein [Streptomyces sp. NBC_00047]MCX5613357.1 caspase family protein [Streptomyces sp. NBC_00047]
MKNLNDALHELHRQAGRPSMRDLQSDLKAPGLLLVPPSHTRIHDVFTRPRLPQCELLACLVRAMAWRARTLDSSVDPEAEWARVFKLWLTADDERQTRYQSLELPLTRLEPEGHSGVQSADRTDQLPFASSQAMSGPLITGLPRAFAAHRPDPAASRAFFLGTSHYSELSDIPAIEAGLHDLRAALSTSNGGSFTESHAATVHNPHQPAQALDPLRRAAEEATDTLLVYIAGHGLASSDNGDLSLAMVGSRPHLSYTALPYNWIRELVSHSPAARRIIILDCCYSGRVTGAMGDMEELAPVAAVEGSYVITSSTATGISMALPGERYTAFTGQILRTVSEGVPGGPPVLDLDTIYRLVSVGLVQRNLPKAQRSGSSNGISALGLVANRAHTAAAPETTM